MISNSLSSTEPLIDDSNINVPTHFCFLINYFVCLIKKDNFHIFHSIDRKSICWLHSCGDHHRIQHNFSSSTIFACILQHRQKNATI